MPAPDSDPAGELIQTKLAPPLRGEKSVVRSVLVRRLRDALLHTLTLVTAPAGFGKTTLLTQWRDHLNREGICTAWVSMDREDDSLIQFGAYLLAALTGSHCGVGRRAYAMVRNDPLAPANSVLAELLNEIRGADCTVVLILDDVDLLESAPVNATLFRLLRYAPPNLHVVMAGRAEPWLPVSHFQMLGQLVRIDADDLRFGVGDSERFFRDVAGLSMRRQEVRKLWRSTEGWVTGLQLASIVRHGRSATKDLSVGLNAASRELHAYITDNVLSAMTTRVVAFILRVSVLDRISPALAASTTGFDDAPQLLDWLERRGLFLAPLNESREWYRFHALFLDYLRNRAEREIPTELATLHYHASCWLASQHFWQEAVRHALAAGAETQAARWVEQCAMSLIERSDLRTVIAWLGRLPAHVIRDSIRLRLAQAWSYSLGLRPIQAALTLRQIEADLESGVLQVPDDRELDCELRAVRAITAGLTDDSPASLRLGREVLALSPAQGTWAERFAHTALVFGLAYDRGFAEARKLRRELSEEESAGTDEPTYAWVYRQCMFGLSALSEGKLIEAEGIFAHALRHAEIEAGINSAAATLPAGYVSTIYYEWGEFDRVERVLGNRDEIALEMAANGSATRYSVTRVRTLALLRKFGAAFRTIERASGVAHDRGWLRMLSACQGEAIRLLIGEHSLVKAVRTFEALRRQMPSERPSPIGSFIETWRSFVIAHSRLAIVRREISKAVAMLDALCGDLVALGLAYLEVTPRLLLAIALDRSGLQATALDHLGQVLRYGQANGLIRSFIDEGEDLRRLILTVQADPGRCPDVESWYLSDLVTEFGRSRGKGLAGLATAWTAALGEREIDILEGLAQGFSNKEIARALGLTPETIKWHLKNIFVKLGVTSRLQAVSLARSRNGVWNTSDDNSAGHHDN